jgi:hypothetical protein
VVVLVVAQQHLVLLPVLVEQEILRQQAHLKETMVEPMERKHLHIHRVVVVALMLLEAMVEQLHLVLVEQAQPLLFLGLA